MKPTLNQLINFCTVAETGNIGKAASQLNISQPPLSRQIAQLETIRKRTARTVLTGMSYSVGSVMRQGSSSLTRLTGQSAMTSRTWRR